MAYLDTKDVYDLFENGVAHLHVADIDELPRINAYKCYVEFDNGAMVTDKVVIVFAENDTSVPSVVDTILCKHNDDSILSLKVKKVNIELNEGFEIVDE